MMNMNEITREQIKNEKDYDKLKDIGRLYRMAGHELSLRAKKSNLKKRLLVIFDETHGTGDEETELDEDKSAPTGSLYKSDRDYADWESGWTFNPNHDIAKPLPKKLTAGLKNAIKIGRIYLQK